MGNEGTPPPSPPLLRIFRKVVGGICASELRVVPIHIETICIFLEVDPHLNENSKLSPRKEGNLTF